MRNTFMHRAAVLVAAASIGCAAHAAIVEVALTGVVEFNAINSGVFAGQGPGSAVSLSFLVDSSDFVNSGSFPTRGYVIDQSSFSLTIGGATVGLQSPFPAGQTPYFVLRNNDPAVDGFFISTNVDFPVGVATDVPGAISPFFINNFSVGYTGDTLDSLDVLDAVGSYDFTGLTSFNWAIQDGPFDAMLIVYEQMTITVIPAPPVLVMLAPLGLLGRRRRRA